jgi:hypothetical protein
MAHLNVFVLLFSEFFDVFPRPRFVRYDVSVGSFWTLGQARKC